MSVLTIRPIKAFTDNYVWCLQKGDDAQVAIVDPGEAAPVLRYLQERQLELSAILITHHHADHVGGIAELTDQYPQAVVYGPANEDIRYLDERLKEGDQVDVLGESFQVLDVPGHTSGHIAYYGAGALFCGDTLFACGCGRVFEGTAEQMTDSLSKLMSLPHDTQVYCAHEYTLDNIGFALWVEPESPQLQSRKAADEASREEHNPTVPSTLDLELQTNPFLRFREPAVIAAAEAHAGCALESDSAVFGHLRHWKDSEYD